MHEERIKKLEERNAEIQKRATELNGEVQQLAEEFKANNIKIALLKELEEGEKDDKKTPL